MIKLADITVTFDGRQILGDTSFEFDDGAVYLLQGPSGSGKSTVLNLIAGYVEPEAGAVISSGVVGYLMQEELLFSELSVVDNLRIRAVGSKGFEGSYGSTGSNGSKPHDTAQIEKVMSDVGIIPLASTRTANISGGERRRVELAAMLMADPAVLLLDEPTTGLDPANVASFYKSLWAISAGRTVIVVTHDTDTSFTPSTTRYIQINNGTLQDVTP